MKDGEGEEGGTTDGRGAMVWEMGCGSGERRSDWTWKGIEGRKVEGKRQER